MSDQWSPLKLPSGSLKVSTAQFSIRKLSSACLNKLLFRLLRDRLTWDYNYRKCTSTSSSKPIQKCDQVCRKGTFHVPVYNRQTFQCKAQE